MYHSGDTAYAIWGQIQLVIIELFSKGKSTTLCSFNTEKVEPEVMAEVRNVLVEVVGPCIYLGPRWCHDVHVALGDALGLRLSH